MISLFLFQIDEGQFNPTLNGTPTTTVKIFPGSEIWNDRNYTLSSMSDGLWGATLFQTHYYINATTLSITSNRDAEIFIALNDKHDGVDGLTETLNSNNWTLNNGWYLEWSNWHKLNKVWSMKLNSSNTTSITSTKNGMTFAILIKEGMHHIDISQLNQLKRHLYDR